MGWKSVLGYFIAIFLVALLFFYWMFPLDTINFGSVSSRNSNFSLIAGNQGMQFYENMRYPEKDISYRIQDCPLNKKDNMERAFDIVDDLTDVNFYSVESNEEILVTCDDEVKYEGDSFVAGEGWPVNITKAGNFNIIKKGVVTLIREPNCPNPNVGIHELLHALGFEHSENPNNIMYPTTKCSQTIGEDIPELINLLYSYPSLPDVAFENVSATMNSRYLDLNIVIRNQGLADSSEGTIEVYADEDLVKEIEFESLEIGHGRKILINNIFILQKDIDELRFFINADFEELEKDNNEVILKYEN